MSGKAKSRKAFKKLLKKNLSKPGAKKLIKKMQGQRGAGKAPKLSLMAWPKPKVKKVQHFGPLERKVQFPSAQQRSWAIGAPQFNGGKPISVRHREYLQPITTVTAFTGAGRYVVQPGLTDNFPWLGQIAQAFEQYTISDLKYVYRNRLATNQNVSIYCAMQYDVSDPEFKTVEELCTYGGARSEVGWTDFTFDAMLSRGKAYQKYFIRTDALAAGVDPQLYDMANFTICAVGTTGNLYAGDLFVEYNVNFTSPKMNPALLGAYGATANMSQSTFATFISFPFQGYNAVKQSFFPSSVQEPIVDEVKSTITFPSPGSYDVGYHLHTTGTASVYANTASGNNLWTVTTPGGGIVADNNQATAANPPVAGWGFTDYAKLVTTVANCVVTFKGLAATGTTSTTMTSILTIAVEAGPYILNYLGLAPIPPLDDLTYQNLKKCFPKHDLSNFERKRQICQFEKDHAEFKRARREELLAIIAESKVEEESKERENSRTEEITKITLDDSGSDVEVNVHRSSSREPGSKKSKKTDLKNRKV